jgi:hypothetical protein
MEALVQELRVHQAELEAQNDELRGATVRAELLSQRYRDHPPSFGRPPMIQ